MSDEIIRENFNQVYTIIELHRSRALQEVNNNSLFIAWNVGAYVSAKIKSSEWGSSVVTELSEYLRTKDPTLKGYSRRNIYMLVKFYETYSAPSFVQMLNQFKLNEPYLLPENMEKQENPIVQFEIAQFPKILLLINWTCHQQILNGCKFNEERIFYIIYAQREHFEVKEIRIKQNHESDNGRRIQGKTHPAGNLAAEFGTIHWNH